jgi:hypothetical protein
MSKFNGLKVSFKNVLNNLGKLAAFASNMATSSIDWSPNIPFELLRNIFENILLDGSKLFTQHLKTKV